MPVTTSSVPFLKEPPVAESKSEAKKVEKAEAKLVPAGSSGDPDVHSLLAQRFAHVSNGDGDKVAEIDEKLAEYGLTAK